LSKIRYRYRVLRFPVKNKDTEKIGRFQEATEEKS